MIIFKKAKDLHSWLLKAGNKALQTGFVPTMGALHNGHISLIKASQKNTDLSIASIFVNPTQFNNVADLEKYPQTIESDLYKLETAGCDIVFLPSIHEMYPNGLQQEKKYELGYLENILEGKFRPGHYQGVCMIIDKLLYIVQPHQLYLGQKDYQQCKVIQKLVGQLDLPIRPVIQICPTQRENDGLAMSSRNMRLTSEEREIAPRLFKTLTFIKENFEKIPIPEILASAEQMITAAGFRPDYIEIAACNNLAPVREYQAGQNCIALIAAYLHEIRLIDNLILTESFYFSE